MEVNINYKKYFVNTNEFNQINHKEYNHLHP